MQNQNEELIELISGMVSDGYSETVGDVDGIGFYARVELDENEEAQENVMEVTNSDTIYYGAVFCEDNYGYKSVILCETQEELINAWREIENDEENHQNEMEN